MSRIVPPLTFLLVLALAPAAHAGWFAADPIDGPADIGAVAIDLGLEDTGALAYVKAGQAWTSAMSRGTWTAPAAIGGAGATEVAVAAGARGRTAVAWIENGNVFGAATGGQATPLSAGGGATGLSIDIGVNGVAYAVWSQAGNVLAARMERAAWTPVPSALDTAPPASAGEGASRPRVAVAADGSALVVWGEAGPDGRTHVIARRIYGTTLSSLPQDATLSGAFEGQAVGSADSPDVDVEYDRSFAWVVFRQDVGGRSRSIARRLRASTFEPPQAIDAGLESGAPRVAISGSGAGHAVASAGGGAMGSLLNDDLFQPAARVDVSGGVSSSRVAFSDRDNAAVAWRAGADASAVVRARITDSEGAFGPETLLTPPQLGPVPPEGFAAGSNRIGDVAVAIVQGAPGARVVGIAMHDLPPARPILRRMRRTVGPRPLVRWNAGQEFLGAQTYRVLIDGRQVATTAKRRYRTRRLRRGQHRVQVIGVDPRGQASTLSRSQRFTVRAKKKRSRRDRG
jgi:hypothetical protein